jgi:hypothetical protein
MKVRETLVLLLVLSLALVPILSQSMVRSQSQSQYGERIDIYTAGVNAYTFVTLNQLNSTSAKLTSAESTSGLSGYRLVAVSAQNLVSDYQIFGVDGYNLLNLPFVPAEGLFLDVNATSASAASPVVSYFDALFETNFTTLASSGNSFSYFGSVDFTTVAAPILFRLVPTTEKGFSLAYTESQFSKFAFPSVTLVGELNSTLGTFTHSIALGEASTSDIGTAGALDFLNAVSQTNTTVSASSSAAKSTVIVHSLDGYVFSTDSAASVSNAASGLSGTYTLTATAGKVVDPNVTIDSQAPTLNAYRTVSLSTQGSTEFLSVTIWLSNTAKNDTDQSMVIQNVTVNDNWWQKYPSVFQLSSGNQSYDTTVAKIVGEHNTTIVYSLKVVSSAASEFIIPATTVGFSYSTGTTTASGHATLNQVDLQLNRNPEPAMNVYVQPDYSAPSGSPLGTSVSMVVEVTNEGLAPATNIQIGNRTFANLPANSTLPSFKVSVPFTGLLQRNISESFTLKWTTPTQQNESITSNSVSLLLSHSAMVIPYIEAGGSDTLTAKALSSGILNVTYGFSNAGSGSAGAVTASQSFPTGMTCKVVNSSDATCKGNEVTFNFPSIAPQSSETVLLQLNFTKDNFIVDPELVSATYGGATLSTAGGPFAVPGGVVLTKSFAPDAVFPGMPSSVAIGMTNVGSQTLYNVTLSSTQDSFDTVGSGTSTQDYFSSVAPQQSESFTYAVKVNQQTSGNLTGTLPAASMILGGLRQSVSLGNSTLVVYKPIEAAVSLNPTNPSDGHNFDVTFVITNYAPVAVSNVTLSWQLPTGVSNVGGTSSSGRLVTHSFVSLGADSTQNVTLTLKANIGLTFNTATDSHLTYNYQNSSISGVITARQITVKEDITTSYEIPIAIAVVIALAALVYMRRNVAPALTPAPAPPAS